MIFLQPASLVLIAAVTIATTIVLRSAYNWYSSRNRHDSKITLDPNKRVPVTLMEKEVSSYSVATVLLCIATLLLYIQLLCYYSYCVATV